MATPPRVKGFVGEENSVKVVQCRAPYSRSLKAHTHVRRLCAHVYGEDRRQRVPRAIRRSMHDAVSHPSEHPPKWHTHTMQRINVQPLASPRKSWIRQEAAAKLGDRGPASRKRSGKAGCGRTNGERSSRTSSLSFLSRSWHNYFSFFLLYCRTTTNDRPWSRPWMTRV